MGFVDLLIAEASQPSELLAASSDRFRGWRGCYTKYLTASTVVLGLQDGRSHLVRRTFLSLSAASKGQHSLVGYIREWEPGILINNRRYSDAIR